MRDVIIYTADDTTKICLPQVKGTGYGDYERDDQATVNQQLTVQKEKDYLKTTAALEKLAKDESH